MHQAAPELLQQVGKIRLVFSALVLEHFYEVFERWDASVLRVKVVFLGSRVCLREDEFKFIQEEKDVKKIAVNARQLVLFCQAQGFFDAACLLRFEVGGYNL